jgi:hypothetical protein
MVLLPEREGHSLGAAMAAVILRNFGLRPLVTRAEGPGGDWLVEFAVSQRTEAVIVVATLPSTLTQLERVISKFRDLLGDTCPQMITAGPAFSADPSLLAHSTADAHLSSLQALARWAEAPV